MTYTTVIELKPTTYELMTFKNLQAGLQKVNSKCTVVCPKIEMPIELNRNLHL